MVTAASKLPAILEAIAAIQKGIEKIPKAGTMKNKAGIVQYSFVRNDDILEEVRKLLVENDVVVAPRILDHRVETKVLGEGNNTRLYTTVTVTLEQTYYSTRDGSTHTVQSVGEGQGYDDKGTRKAVTQAQKVANLLTFSIATGEEDPDAVDPQASAPAQVAPAKPVAPVVDPEIETLKQKIADKFAEREIITPDQIKTEGDRFFEGRQGWANAVPALRKLLKALEDGESW